MGDILSNMKKLFKIGTRASPLALRQTQLLIQALKNAHPDVQTQVVEITTSGDKIQDRSLAQAGGKGLFTKEIEEALYDGSIDMAVHSMKDMPTQLPDGLIITALLPREDPRDVFFSPIAKTIDDLPQGAIVGTSSLRRQAIVLARRPDLQVITFRGNVGTRLQKLQDGVAHATMLALAGIKRMGWEDKITSIIDTDIMLPAVGQGAIGIETREDDTEARTLLESIHCPQTDLTVSAERAYLSIMDGSCRTPIAALARMDDGLMTLDVLIARPDGSDLIRRAHSLPVAQVADAIALGHQAGTALRDALPKDYFQAP